MSISRVGTITLGAGVFAVAVISQIAPAQSPRGRTKAVAERDSEKPAAHPGQIVVNRSAVYAFVGKTGLGHEHGVEGKVKSGAIQIGSRSHAGQIVFDMASFKADTPRARKYVGLEGSTTESTRQQVNNNMLGADVLNVAKYPTATFAVESALQKKSAQGKPVVELKGEFLLHGTSRPLTVVAELSQKDGNWHLRGDFRIRQTDFGIAPYSAALGAVGVADELRIYGDVWIAGDDAQHE